MASLTVSGVGANVNADQPHAGMPLENVPANPSYSTGGAETNQPPTTSSRHRDGKIEKLSEEKEKILVTSSPSEFFMADGTTLLTEEGYLKAPEPSIGSSDLWHHAATLYPSRQYFDWYKEMTRRFLSNPSGFFDPRAVELPPEAPAGYDDVPVVAWPDVPID
ncbi:hypothetical protein PIB30_030340 [Stylosanthes scabra]|uniref:Chlorophyll a-b binding protein, chloroplastic n=1 Tax=Stylosanthes scabra TaxID=79078 RepID=A0ABU6UBW9_9FABA|nr:hypothetical protein [Stylosanthes scabra]